ncbi:unnamed protein product [Euphydryas editha]|uniref:Uncharacterized protein n=1 Tax=Euphydryas editha TaxID=104508 RepID=A0AAU9ULS7_EUPED|nr:unnamed protein product [Euphydryas editha]
MIRIVWASIWSIWNEKIPYRVCLPPEQLPHNQQNMYYFQQNNQQDMNNELMEQGTQQEINANDSVSQLNIKFNN